MEYRAIYADESLAHHGIKGQKWGVRRYQNPDGSLTDEGRKRYGKSLERKREKAEIKRDIYRGREAMAKRDKKNAAIGGGGGAGIATMLTFGADNIAIAKVVTPAALGVASLPISVATGVGAGAMIYGAYRGKQAIDHMLAEHQEKKISEIDRMLSKNSDETNGGKKTKIFNPSDEQMQKTMRNVALIKEHEGIMRGRNPESWKKYLKSLSVYDRLNTAGIERALNNDYRKNVKQVSGQVKAMKNSGYTVSEISEMIGLPEGTVKDYLYK